MVMDVSVNARIEVGKHKEYTAIEELIINQLRADHNQGRNSVFTCCVTLGKLLPLLVLVPPLVKCR